MIFNVFKDRDKKKSTENYHTKLKGWAELNRADAVVIGAGSGL